MFGNKVSFRGGVAHVGEFLELFLVLPTLIKKDDSVHLSDLYIHPKVFETWPTHASVLPYRVWKYLGIFQLHFSQLEIQLDGVHLSNSGHVSEQCI